MAHKTYNPNRVSVSFKGVNITGFADGTFIECERNEDGFMLQVGATGHTTRTQNQNRSGKVTITLVQASLTNDILAAIMLADEESGDQSGSLQIKDTNGTMMVRAKDAWINKTPKSERAKEAGTVVWVFECASLFIFPGGNVA